MAEYKLTNKAVEDLAEIWDYTFDKWSEKQANDYYNLLLDSCQKIANSPKLGKNYEGIKSELLGLKTGKHIIFYRKLRGSLIEITRVLHEQMNLKKRITE